MLKGLLDLERTDRTRAAVRAARRAGEEYLLERRLRRRLGTGQDVGPWVHELSHPPRWRYDVLNALDHVREAALLDGSAPDPRLEEAVELVRAARQPDGR